VFRKFSNSLGPESLDFIEQILDEHRIQDEEIEASIEALAKEYNKQDGVFLYMIFDSLHSYNEII
jgi:DNA polymerase epsilon subunit 2